ncbi:hypothetical protein [Luteococcus sanguinis]|uniref:Type II secretion system F family protein n=1 Tax=Luteococcus sanguinis TaxID=174038 RepID=A0ABW1X4Q0_9ACTN
MRDPIFGLVVLSGMACALGLFVIGLSFTRRPPRLADALAALDDSRPTRTVVEVATGDQDWATRFGSALERRLRVPVSDRVRSSLALQGRTVGDWLTQKAILGLLGLAAPPLAVALMVGAGGLAQPVPLVVSLALGAVGWFYPDLAIRGARRATHADAAESLHTLFDLVTLERLANQSSTQALASAAAMSDAPIFQRIRTCIERARLEQRPPWTHLKALADELELPEIADMADVMRLDDQGAPLADVMRARVRELRDAHLTREKQAAHEVSERMTVWMVIPSLVFGLLFLTPPLLRLSGLG